VADPSYGLQPYNSSSKTRSDARHLHCRAFVLHAVCKCPIKKSVTRKSTRADTRLSHSLQDEAIEAGGEGRGVLRQFAVKNLRLFQQ
jgi:hypothetical protein